MARIFSFSNVNSLRDIDSNRAKKTCLTFEKYILNKHHKNQDQNRSPTVVSFDKLSTKNVKSTKVQEKEQKEEDRSRRLLGRVKSLNSILMNKLQDPTSPSSPRESTRPSSIHKKVSFKELVMVIDMGVKKKVKLVEKESKLRNGYFFSSVRTQ